METATGANLTPLGHRNCQPFDYTGHDAYRTIPPLQFPNEELEPNTATQFKKMWDKSMNYSGEVYDIFDDKIRHFLNVCSLVRIRPTQFHAVIYTILTKEAKEYFLHHVSLSLTFAGMYTKLKSHFDTEINHHKYTDWCTTTYQTIRREKANHDKDPEEILQILLRRLPLCQRALGAGYAGETQLVTTTLRACRGVPELDQALFTPARTFEALSSQLRSSIENWKQGTVQLQAPQQFFADRKYYRRQDRDQRSQQQVPPRSQPTWKKKCYVCGKQGCFSTKHSDDERRKVKELYLRKRQFNGKGSGRPYQSFLAEFEGDPDDEEDDEDEQDTEDSDSDPDSFFTVSYLTNEAFKHRLLPSLTISSNLATFDTNDHEPETAFLLDRYSRDRFQGILPDKGAAKTSTAGIAQVYALQREVPTVQFVRDHNSKAIIRFGSGEPLVPLGTITVPTPVGHIDFQIINAPTPFLLCLQDMDPRGIFYNNLTNELSQPVTPSR